MGERSRIRVLWRDEEFVCLCDYEDRGIPKAARFWWDRERRLWVSKSAKCAARLMEYCNEAARQTIVDRLAGMPRMGFMNLDRSISRLAHRYRYNA